MVLDDLAVWRRTLNGCAANSPCHRQKTLILL